MQTQEIVSSCARAGEGKVKSAFNRSLNVNPPIFDLWPQLIERVPYRRLGCLPTPLHSWEFAGRPVLVKRDDLSGQLYGGNKLRKLEFILARALAQGHRRVVSFGATGTHHGLATVLYCRELGLDCELLLFPQPPSEAVQRNRQALQQAGAQCHDFPSLAAVLRRFYLHPRRWRRDTLFLFAGGSGVEGTLAFINAGLEWAAQLRASDTPPPERLYLACSSGSTLAGLTLGCQLAGLGTQVIGVRVIAPRLGPFAACTPGSVQALMRQTRRFLRRQGVSWRGPLPAVQLNGDFLGGGYGEATPQAQAAAAQFAQHTGIALDPTYTAKAFAAVLADREPGRLAFWNTLSSVAAP